MKNFGRVAVLLGGRSRERSVSLRSGKAVLEALRSKGVEAVPIDTRNGFSKVLKSDQINIAFIALHGSGGEDGSIQKFLTRRKILFVGSNAKASATAFDKERAKTLFLKHGIPTPKFKILTHDNWRKILRNWDESYVIKPTKEGSSIGVILGLKESKNDAKIIRGLKRYKRLLIEEKIEGREFTVGILGEKALPVIELKPKRVFYDYKAKYTKGLTDYLIPAPIPLREQKALQRLALRVHRLLGMRDLSRVDMMVDREGRPFVLEANSIPGFTETSLLPKAARRMGLHFSSLCLSLIKMAKNRKH